MKHILIPTDFSDCANNASEFALEIAQKSKIEIDFLHLLATPVDWVKLPKDKEKNFHETRKKIGHAKSELSKSVKKANQMDVKANKSLVFDKGIEEVFNHIENSNCDLIIMGSHGTKGFKEMLISSNAQKILRNANVPVLIVKNKINHPIKNILFVSDFKDVSQTAFHSISNFADIVGAHIELLFINTPNEFTQSKETDDNMERMLLHCNRSDACTKNVINATSVEQGIKDFADSNPIDLIAICTHGKGSFVQLFNPSIAEKIANHTSLPLLSIKL